MTGWKRERLGEVLLEAGLIDESQLEAALEVQSRDGGKLGEVLVRQLTLTEEQIARGLATQKGLDHVDLTVYPIDGIAAKILPERFCRMRDMICVGFKEDAIVLAMGDPLDIEAMDDVELRTGLNVVPVVASPTQVSYAIDKYIASVEMAAEIGAECGSLADEIEIVEDVPVVRLVNQLLRDAVRDGASDVHFEPEEHRLRVRMRIDGVLREVTDLPAKAIPGIISRLKVMSDMDIAERRRPQDGRIALQVDSRKIDLRAVCLPTHWGEGFVLRILNSDVSYIKLEDLGMSEAAFGRLTGLLTRPWGAVLVSGPTGSGKTTTLYAALDRINDPGRKIISVEDPVEYLLPGVTQMAVNARIGVTFATGLRTMLRSDPDIVMVGEIRDPETAEIAVRAALTGHLVLSSIHTNDAPSAITRLADMGIPPYITSSAVLGVVAQRLVRVLCPACKEPDHLGEDRLMAAGFTPEEARAIMPFRAVGCDRCRMTGFRGRVGIFEVMPVSSEIERLALTGSSVEQIRAIALAEGMIPLRRDALDKVAQGITSLEEADRVVMS